MTRGRTGPAVAVLALIASVLLATARAANADDVLRLEVDGRERRCVVHVGRGADVAVADVAVADAAVADAALDGAAVQRGAVDAPSPPVPLVLLLHGAGGNGKWQLDYSGFAEVADREGFVVAAPDGTGRLKRWMLAWNAGGCCGYAQSRDVDDVAFLRRLLDELCARYRIDPRRIYAAGLSNGGMMCYRLAREVPGRFAAIAVVSGTHLGDVPREDLPSLPVLHFHGTRDRLVPFAGGSSREWSPTSGFRAADECARLWAKHNGCPQEPQCDTLPDRFDDGTRVTVSRFGPGREGSEVVLYVIDGGGHTWPGRTFFSHFEAPQWTRKLSPLGRTTLEIDASALIWSFFAAHALPDP